MSQRSRTPLRLLAVAFVTGAMLIPLAAPASAAGFRDVPANHQFYREIIWASQQNITNGYTADNTFRPKENVSREAFAAFLYRLAGRPNVNLPATSPFRDVPTNAQFYKEIVWASQRGITNGYTADNTFRPRQTIDRDAMAAFIYRYEGRPSFTPPSSSPFRDMRPSDPFYREVTWLRHRGITNGYTADNTYRPRIGVSREATAAFLYRLAGRPNVNLPAPGSFTVTGAGFGHGVGLSQYGAWDMAKNGSSAEQILRHYYTGATVGTQNDDRNIRVEIFGSGADNHNSLDIIVRGNWRMRFYTAPTTYTEWTGTSGERLRVTRNVSGQPNSVRVTRANGTSAIATRDVVLHWENTTHYQPSSSSNATVELYRAGTSTRATHGTYRHGRIFISVPSTVTPRLIVANELHLQNEYLPGIAEMPSSWDDRALQAQAIVARGYALRNMGSMSATCNCHLYDDTRSQNFTGWNKENEGATGQWGAKWSAAVRATQGRVVMSGSTIAQTYYFSSTGGRTENSNDIWVANLSYLRAVPDPGSTTTSNPNRAWTRTLTQAQARSAFGLPDVVSIRVTSRTQSHSNSAASVVTATSSTGQTATIRGPETIRSRLAGGHSPWIWSFTPQ